MKDKVRKPQLARLAFLVALTLVTLVSVVASAAAEGGKTRPASTLASLEGPWQITLIGNTGCGFTSMLVNVTLNSEGSGSATTTYHSGCGDNTQNSLPFAVQTLNANGSGTANLSCGSGCGWEFNIQVSKNGQIFNLVDVYPENPDNYVEGTAIRQ